MGNSVFLFVLIIDVIQYTVWDNYMYPYDGEFYLVSMYECNLYLLFDLL